MGILPHLCQHQLSLLIRQVKYLTIILICLSLNTSEYENIIMCSLVILFLLWMLCSVLYNFLSTQMSIFLLFVRTILKRVKLWYSKKNLLVYYGIYLGGSILCHIDVFGFSVVKYIRIFFYRFYSCVLEENNHMFCNCLSMSLL